MDKAQESFGFLLQDVARLMRRDFNRKGQELGLTQAQWQILVRIARCEGARQSQIADMLEMQPISVTRLIDRMESAGWVERRPDPADRRAINLYLTDKVAPVINEMKLRGAQTRALAVAGISREDQKIFFDVLQKVRDNFANVESEEK